jgi:hypothetical protein
MWYLGPIARLDVDDHLQRKVETVEQPPEGADPASPVCLGGAGKANWAGPDRIRHAGPIPKDGWAASDETDRAERQRVQPGAAMTSTSSRNALLAGASGNATTVAWLSAAASWTLLSSGIRPASNGPAPQSR